MNKLEIQDKSLGVGALAQQDFDSLGDTAKASMKDANAARQMAFAAAKVMGQSQQEAAEATRAATSAIEKAKKAKDEAAALLVKMASDESPAAISPMSGPAGEMVDVTVDLANLAALSGNVKSVSGWDTRLNDEINAGARYHSL